MSKPKLVSYKNIDPILIDIKRPDYNYEESLKFRTVNLRHIPQFSVPIRHSGKKIFRNSLIGAAVFVLLFLVLIGNVALDNLREIKTIFLNDSGVIVSNFESSVEALKKFEPKTAVDSLRVNDIKLAGLNEIITTSHRGKLIAFLGNFVPAIKEVGGLLKRVSSLNVNFLKLAESISDLQNNGFRYFQNDGRALVASLSKTQNLMRSILDEVASIKNTTARLKSLSPIFGRLNDSLSDQYVRYNSELRRWDKFLSEFISLINASEEKHILLLFQNPAEIRPGGGFVGSYADLVIRYGQMLRLETNDIYLPDGQLAAKIIPPEPLQKITKDWGARDANWFFNFPDSAETIINFLEKSKLYEEQGIKFEGAIALNIRLVETLLKILGPINLPEYNLVINEDNFLKEIQKEVEAGEDKKAGEPKKILKVLTPLLLAKINFASVDDQKNIIQSFSGHIANKDIMFSAKNREIASVLKVIGVDGSIFSLPNDFWGGYLAVVNANIAGGKTDAFISQSIEANIDIDSGGNAFADLTVARTHSGNKEKDPWWKMANKNFIQIFVNDIAHLIFLDGNDKKIEMPKTDYENDYLRDDRVQAIEKTKVPVSNYNSWTYKYFGKTIFGAWLQTLAGESTSFKVRYEIPYIASANIQNGDIYRFIYEKQSGVNSSVQFKISAPLGYNWAESKNQNYIYEADNTESRVIISLTLQK